MSTSKATRRQRGARAANLHRTAGVEAENEIFRPAVAVQGAPFAAAVATTAGRRPSPAAGPILRAQRRLAGVVAPTQQLPVTVTYVAAMAVVGAPCRAHVSGGVTAEVLHRGAKGDDPCLG